MEIERLGRINGRLRVMVSCKQSRYVITNSAERITMERINKMGFEQDHCFMGDESVSEFHFDERYQADSFVQTVRAFLQQENKGRRM